MTDTATYSTNSIVKDNLAFILVKRDRSCNASRLIRELITAEASRLRQELLYDDEKANDNK